MHRVSLTSAIALTPRRLSQLLNRAYADYPLPVRLDADQFKSMCDDMDVDLACSAVALAGARPVGLALLSRRDGEGWVSGVGVHPDWRRNGIAQRMIRRIQQTSWREGLQRLRLEVLEQNRAAYSLYEQVGFARTRDLLALTLESEWLSSEVGQVSRPPFGMAPGDIAPERAGRLLHYHARFHEVDPSWQRDLPSLTKRLGYIMGLACREASALVGYLIYVPQVGRYTILDLAVDPSYPQRVRVAERLLGALHGTAPNMGGHIINVPAEDPLLPAFMARGYRVWQRQHEMASQRCRAWFNEEAASATAE